MMNVTHLMIQSERYHFDMITKKPQYLDENICSKTLLKQTFSFANFLFLIEQKPHFLILIQTLQPIILSSKTVQNLLGL